jgi:hypothetical protein
MAGIRHEAAGAGAGGTAAGGCRGFDEGGSGKKSKPDCDAWETVMPSFIEQAMEAEERITEQCVQVFGPINATANAQQLMARAERIKKQDREIVALMLPEVNRVLKREKAK